MPEEPLILAEDVHRTYLLGKKVVEVLRGIDLEIMQGERQKVMGFGNAACEATKVFTESNGAGRSCYSVRSRYTQTVNEMCGTTYQLQLNADGEIPLPASWRELFRYQR